MSSGNVNTLRYVPMLLEELQLREKMLSTCLVSVGMIVASLMG